MSERDERLAARGPQGKQGSQGDRGEKGSAGAPGLSRSVRRALVYMFALNLLLVAVVYLWLGHEVTVIAANAATNARQVAAAAAANGRQRCASLEEDVRIPVPQPVAHNPSREFDAQLEAVDRQRAHQLHCPGF